MRWMIKGSVLQSSPDALFCAFDTAFFIFVSFFLQRMKALCADGLRCLKGWHTLTPPPPPAPPTHHPCIHALAWGDTLNAAEMT